MGDIADMLIEQGIAQMTDLDYAADAYAYEDDYRGYQKEQALATGGAVEKRFKAFNKAIKKATPKSGPTTDTKRGTNQ